MSAKKSVPEIANLQIAIKLGSQMANLPINFINFLVLKFADLRFAELICELATSAYKYLNVLSV
jgi:hypothetical protein